MTLLPRKTFGSSEYRHWLEETMSYSRSLSSFPHQVFKLSDKQDLCRFCGWENIIFPTPPFPHSDLPRSSEELKNWMIRLYQVILVLVFFFKEYS